MAFVNLGDVLSADESGELVIEVAGMNAVSEGALAVDLDAHLGNGCLLFDASLLHSRDLAGNVSDPGADASQLVEVRSVDFDCDLGGDATEHVANAVGKRAANRTEGPGNSAHGLPNFIEDLFSSSFAFVVELHIEFDG